MASKGKGSDGDIMESEGRCEGDAPRAAAQAAVRTKSTAGGAPEALGCCEDKTAGGGEQQGGGLIRKRRLASWCKRLTAARWIDLLSISDHVTDYSTPAD
jgi:hypothetical protein